MLEKLSEEPAAEILLRILLEGPMAKDAITEAYPNSDPLIRSLLTNGVLYSTRDALGSELLDVPAWARSRLYEASMAFVGLKEYIDGLVRYRGSRPDRDVPINGNLAAFQVSTSANSLVSQTLQELGKNGKSGTDKKTSDVMSKLISPPKSFEFRRTDISLRPTVVEDARNAVMRNLYDRVIRVQQKRSSEAGFEEGSPPSDLKRVGSVPSLPMEIALGLSKPTFNHVFIIRQGMVTWQPKPASEIYLRDGALLYSPSRSKLTEAQADEYHALIQSMVQQSAQNRCDLCRVREASRVAAFKDHHLGFVCNECQGHESIFRLFVTAAPGDML